MTEKLLTGTLNLSTNTTYISKFTMSDFWTKLCGMTVFSKEDKKCVLGYSEQQCKLELCDIGTEVDHATAFGRIAFSCPREEVKIFDKMGICG